MHNLLQDPKPRRSEELILDRVRAFVQDTFLYMLPDAVIDDTDSLMQRGVVDSMGVAEMLAFLEEEFGVNIGDDEITEANLGSLRAIASFVAARQAYP